jgi:hypothetical protein
MGPIAGWMDFRIVTEIDPPHHDIIFSRSESLSYPNDGDLAPDKDRRQKGKATEIRLMATS